jgi:transcriptional regulator with XRE-family HTH domain
MAPEIDVRAIRRAVGMTQAEFAAAYQFSVRTVQQWERGRSAQAARLAHYCAPSKPIPRVCAGRSQPRERIALTGDRKARPVHFAIGAYLPALHMLMS